MDFSAGTSAELGRGSNKKLKHVNLPLKEDNDVHPITFCTARQLCEDELSLIFRNVVISTQDLLNFRLVNKVWCEAATACLRQSDASLICIALRREIPAVPQEDSDDQDEETGNDALELFSCRHKYKDSAMTQLSDLINLMSNSSKFPSSNVHLYWSGGSSPSRNFSNYPELLLFFKLHGSKIKTLCLQSFVSYELLYDILFIHLPDLERLDLSKAELMPMYSDEKEVDYLTTKGSTLSCHQLKCLVLNDTLHNNLSPLLSPPFKLSSIYNVNFHFLPVLLKKDKANLRLVAGIHFHPRNFEEALPLMHTEFSWKYPNLSELTLVLEDSMSEWGLQGLAQMNKLLYSSKDTLKHLKISVYSDLYRYRSKLNIPPMKNLKCLTFSGMYQACRVDEWESGDRISVFALKDKIPPEKYFSSLVKVRLKKLDLRTPNNFVWLFKFKPEYQGIVSRSCFPNVETLEVEDVLWPKIPDANLFSECFPNVRVLKTDWKWKWSGPLESSLWVMCPLVEFMEIYDDDDYSSNNDSVYEDWALSFDAFFTGFPRDLCSKLRRETLPQHMNNPVTLNFFRIAPSICDLQNLKKFKLKFLQRPSTRVASHVTQAYAFAQMPSTKFILEDDSYPPQSSADTISPAANFDTGLEPEIPRIITTHNTLLTDEIKNIDENCIPVTVINDLCKDQISTILNLVPISTNELLTLRLVSKLWRDVATEILLQRESCHITLYIKKIRVAEIEHYNNRFGFGNKFCQDKYGQKQTQLSALTKLMANSASFPASHVHLHSEAYDHANYRDYSDLLQFFRLHGSKIKTLCHYGCLSTKDLWDTLFIHAPALECLDLSSAKLRFSLLKNDYSTFSEVAAIPTTGRPHTLTSLVFSYELVDDDKAFGELINGLLSLPSNLRRIENVNLRTLAHILKNGKGDLIKSFEYIMDGDTFKRHYSLMKQLSTASPKLSTLTLDLKEPKLYNAIVASVNAMLESSKDTLQVLQVSIAPLEYGQQLKIPPLKSLKCIILHSLISLQVLCWKIKHPFDGERTSVFLLEDGVCGQRYFPSLFNVVLRDQDFREVKENILSFFNFHSDQNDGRNSNRNYFPTVTALEILNCLCYPTLSVAWRLSVIFPNVRVMKINWHSFDVENLKGNLWVLSPVVEFMEIYDVSNLVYQDDPTTSVDIFFTGFSMEFITKLRTAHEIPQIVNDPETWNFLRTAPSICNLRHLKEFKLKFLKGSLTQFASRITGDFAFAQMPSTNFIISYDPETFFEDISQVNIDQELFLCFSSIRPFAQVVCEERIDYRHMK